MECGWGFGYFLYLMKYYKVFFFKNVIFNIFVNSLFKVDNYFLL